MICLISLIIGLHIDVTSSTTNHTTSGKPSMDIPDDDLCPTSFIYSFQELQEAIKLKMVHFDLLLSQTTQVPGGITISHPEYQYIVEKRFLTFQQAHDFCLPLEVPIVEIHSDKDLNFYHSTFPDITQTWLDTVFSGKTKKLTFASGKPVPALLKDTLTMDQNLASTKPCTVINLSTGKITSLLFSGLSHHMCNSQPSDSGN